LKSLLERLRRKRKAPLEQNVHGIGEFDPAQHAGHARIHGPDEQRFRVRIVDVLERDLKRTANPLEV
jgi:hypothetical protein